MSRRRNVLVAALVPLTLLVTCARAEEPNKPTRAPDNLASLKTSELIDRLTEISAEGVGSHSTAWASGFLAVDQEPRFHGGVLGSKRPAVSPVMRELVRRGTHALPDLLKHVTDARRTKLVVGQNGFFMGIWHGDEYHPRYRDAKKRPAGVNSPDDAPGRHQDVDKYTVRVGDLCYVAIGQIVNRGLHALRYQPTACLVINSPVKTPALARAVRADWAGLTPEQHERSLRQDALDLSNPWAAPSALVRLLYYYPRSGRALALKLLDRPLYDSGLAFDFFLEKLVPAKDTAQWPLLMSAFRQAHGEANYRGFQWVLVWASTFPESQMTEERRRYKRVADKLLGRYFPWFDPRSPEFLDAVSCTDQEELIDALAAFPSDGLDDAILGLFRRCVVLRPQSLSDRIEQGDLAMACARRLMPKGHRQELLPFFVRRVGEFKDARKDPVNGELFIALDQRIEMMGQLIEGKAKPGSGETPRPPPR